MENRKQNATGNRTWWEIECNWKQNAMGNRMQWETELNGNRM